MSTDTQFWWEDMTPGTVRDLGSTPSAPKRSSTLPNSSIRNRFI